jgi:3-dehydroquinate synthase
MAELIKTAVIGDGGLFEILASGPLSPENAERSADCIARAVAVKGRIVESDPAEKSGERALLNLGHTFGHALESSAGLGRLSHGEAVAWGIARSCDLGEAIGVTPLLRSRAIRKLLGDYGFELRAPHPLSGDHIRFMEALGGDKKKRAGTPSFIVPGKEGALAVSAASFGSPEKDMSWKKIVTNIINGASQ